MIVVVSRVVFLVVVSSPLLPVFGCFFVFAVVLFDFSWRWIPFVRDYTSCFLRLEYWLLKNLVLGSFVVAFVSFVSFLLNRIVFIFSLLLLYSLSDFMLPYVLIFLVVIVVFVVR